MNVFLCLYHFIIVFGFFVQRRQSIEDFDFKVSSIHSLLKSKTWNCTDVVKYFMRRIVEYNGDLNAIISLNLNALNDSRRLDSEYYKNGQFSGRLHCVPILVKDNIDVGGLATTGGIFALHNSIPLKDSYVISRLREQGAIILAKTNLGELAGASSYSEVGGTCMLPWNPNRSCGASSIGTGAGLAAGLGVIGLGTDTGGSVMTPSSFNYLFGLRPALNELSVDGIIPSFERQDTVGPMAKHLDDVILAYSVMTSNHSIYHVYKTTNQRPKTIRLGYIKNFFQNYYFHIENLTYLIDDEIRQTLETAIHNLKTLGISVKTQEIDSFDFNRFLNLSYDMMITGSTECQINCFEYSMDKYFADPARFNAQAPYKNFEQFLNSSKSRYWDNYFDGTNVDNPEQTCSESCIKYDQLRVEFIGWIKRWFKHVDVLVFPTNIDLPFRLNLTYSNYDFNNVNPTYLAPFAGYPTLNVPIGFSSVTEESPEGLPIGMMLLTPQQHLNQAFQIAKLYENHFLSGMKPMPKRMPLIGDSRFLLLTKNTVKNNGLVIRLNLFLVTGLYQFVLFLINFM